MGWQSSPFLQQKFRGMAKSSQAELRGIAKSSQVELRGMAKPSPREIQRNGKPFLWSSRNVDLQLKPVYTETIYYSLLLDVDSLRVLPQRRAKALYIIKALTFWDALHHSGHRPLDSRFSVCASVVSLLAVISSFLCCLSQVSMTKLCQTWQLCI